MIGDRDDDMSDSFWNGFMWGFIFTGCLCTMITFGIGKYYDYKIKHAYDPIQATMLGTVDYREMSKEDQELFNKAVDAKDFKTQTEIFDKYIEKKKNPVVRLWNKIRRSL